MLMEPKVNILVLHEVKKKNIKKGVRYLIHAKDRLGDHWWVGTFYSSRERVWVRGRDPHYENREVFGSELSDLSFVPMDKIDAVYSLP